MKKLLIVLLLYFPLHAYTQEWLFEYAIGYGSYQLDDIKNVQHSMVNTYGLQETDRFPNYFTNTLSVGYGIKQHHFGVNFSYLTTGGRLHRADYSGSYRVDMIMNGYRLGAFYRRYFKPKFSPLTLYWQLNSGVLYSHLQIKEQVMVLTSSSQETTDLTGYGLYLEPTVGFRYRLASGLQLLIGGGYEIGLSNGLKISGNTTNIIADWSGFRFYGGLTITLPSYNKSQNE